MDVFKLAIIGNGTTAVNTIHRLLEQYEATVETLAPIEITVFGNGPEQDCGKGFAFGRLGGVVGNLTESPAAGRADYGTRKGLFIAYAFELLGHAVQGFQSATRELVGLFHADRYQKLKVTAEKLGIPLSYRHLYVTDLVKKDDGYSIIAEDGPQHITVDGFDHVTLAVGDILSRKFQTKVQEFPGRIFTSPYHAYDAVLKNHTEHTVILALGTRSSFVDTVIGYIAKGYRGKIIGISNTGQTAWPGDELRTGYSLRYLTQDAVFRSMDEVLTALKQELETAKAADVYVPDDLLRQIGSNPIGRLFWTFDLHEEARFAQQGMTYHDVMQNVGWEKIYEGLANPRDQQRFNTVLADFALYNRVNRIVPSDYQRFVAAIDAGRVEIVKARFDESQIGRSPDNRIAVKLPHRVLVGDYIVNCAIGPAPAEVQAKNHSLLGNLVERGWLALGIGSGFNVNPAHAIALLGAQARPYPFSGIGLESYGRQIEAWVAKIVQSIKLKPQSSAVPAHPMKGIENV